MDKKNKVELIGHYGSDETHALSAWTSTWREVTAERWGRMPALLKMLASDGHDTPFEKSYLHFVVTCETASHIHFLKHRIAVSINGESARYKELKDDKYYIPPDWPPQLQRELELDIIHCLDRYHYYLKKVEEIRGRKRAKDSARFILPYGNQIVLDVGFNFRSFMWFLGLRKKDEAQNEIHELADQMLELVRDTGSFTHSLEGFGYGESDSA